MILTVEYDVKGETVEIYSDKEGLQFFINKINNLIDKGGHTHFMTPHWAGSELTEQKQGEDTELINHLVIALKPKS